MTESNRSKNILVAVINWFELVPDIYEKVIEDRRGLHAEELETSMLLALGVPVDMKKAQSYVSEPAFPKFQKPSLSGIYAQPAIFWRTGELRQENPSGVLGDPKKASREKGEKILEATVDRLAEFLRELKRTKLEDLKGL